MAIDLLNLINKNTALAGMDTSFGGLTEEERASAVSPTAALSQESDTSSTEPGARSDFGGTFGQFAGLAGNVLGMGMALSNPFSAPAAYSLYSNMNTLLGFDEDTKSKVASFIDNLLGVEEEISPTELGMVSEALFGGLNAEEMAALSEALFGDTVATPDLEAEMLGAEIDFGDFDLGDFSEGAPGTEAGGGWGTGATKGDEAGGWGGNFGDSTDLGGNAGSGGDEGNAEGGGW